MPKHAQDPARIVSVRLPDDLLQRLDRVLDWYATARQRPATRNAAIREALRAWLEPIPGYESAHCEFLLPGATEGRDDDRRRPC